MQCINFFLMSQIPPHTPKVSEYFNCYLKSSESCHPFKNKHPETRRIFQQERFLIILMPLKENGVDQENFKQSYYCFYHDITLLYLHFTLSELLTLKFYSQYVKKCLNLCFRSLFFLSFFSKCFSLPFEKCSVCSTPSFKDNPSLSTSLSKNKIK